MKNINVFFKVFIAAFLVLLIPVTSNADQASKRIASDHRLLRVTLYTYGLRTGRQIIDMENMQIRALGYVLPSQEKTGMPSFESNVTANEMKSLKKLMENSGLRYFQPRLEWFEGYNKEVCFDGGAELVITWDDKEVIFGIPPTERRSKLPKKALRIYEEMDKIIDRLFMLTSKYANKSNITFSEDWGKSSQAKQFYSEMDIVSKKSLPVGRKGW